MKNHFISLTVLIFALYLGSCKNNNTEENIMPVTDTLTEETGTSVNAETEILNDLLAIKDEAELKEIFGEENVSWDTIWGAEGEFTMGTYLFNGTDDEVQIFWEDDMKKERVSAAIIEIKWEGDDYNNYNCNTRWKTTEGFTICSTLDEIVKYNAKPITFLGFGWDYSGMVTSFEGGKLENAGVGMTLGISPEVKQDENYPTDMLGDQEFSSDNPFAKSTPIVIVRLNVHKVEVN
jgi:hypothetical protein